MVSLLFLFEIIFLFIYFLEYTDPVYIYFLNYGFIEELVKEQDEEEEGGNKKFICLMGLMMIMVVFFGCFLSLPL